MQKNFHFIETRCNLQFPRDGLEHTLLLNLILLIFKNILYKARENKSFNLNILKNYLTKFRDLEDNLKDNDKCNKKWTVISSVMFHKKLIDIKSIKKVL